MNNVIDAQGAEGYWTMGMSEKGAGRKERK